MLSRIRFSCVKETEGIVSVTMQLPNVSELWESLQSMRRNKDAYREFGRQGCVFKWLSL